MEVFDGRLFRGFRPAQPDQAQTFDAPCGHAFEQVQAIGEQKSRLDALDGRHAQSDVDILFQGAIGAAGQLDGAKGQRPFRTAPRHNQGALARTKAAPPHSRGKLPRKLKPSTKADLMDPTIAQETQRGQVLVEVALPAKVLSQGLDADGHGAAATRAARTAAIRF